MESVPRDCNDEEETAHELSEIELEELLTTKFLEAEDAAHDCDNEEETAHELSEKELENLLITKIRGPEDQKEDENQIETAHAVVKEEIDSDGAAQLLNRILKSPEQDLKKPIKWIVFEKSRKWKNTSRVSELNLINSVIQIVDYRPTHLHIYCRRLIESDLPNIIGQCLAVEPPTKFSSLFRITLKTEMPLKQIIGLLGNLVIGIPNIQIYDCIGTALRKNIDGTTQKFMTGDVGEMAELEPILTSSSVQPMSETARFTCKCIGKPFVTVNVDYHNEVDNNGKRCKTIVIQQLVTPLAGKFSNRCATFGPQLVEQVHVFEIDDNLPFRSLKCSFKIQNLVDFLKRLGNRNTTTFKNVTFR